MAKVYVNQDGFQFVVNNGSNQVTVNFTAQFFGSDVPGGGFNPIYSDTPVDITTAIDANEINDRITDTLRAYALANGFSVPKHKIYMAPFKDE